MKNVKKNNWKCVSKFLMCCSINCELYNYFNCADVDWWSSDVSSRGKKQTLCKMKTY